MAVYLSSELIEVYTSSWIDITSRVIKDINNEWGIEGHSLNDRVASTGDFTIRVNNSDNYFTIGHASALAGFNKGCYVRYTVGYDDKTFVKEYGRIDAIEPSGGNVDDTEVKINVVDFMDQLARFKMEGFTLYSDRRADEGIQLIFNAMPAAPLDVVMEQGIDTFPSIFDTIQPSTKGLSEIAKLTLSEMGYAYLRKAKGTGETFYFDSRTGRDSKPVNGLPVLRSASDYLITQAGDFLITQAGDNIVLNQETSFTFTDNMINADVEFGGNLVNDLTMISYPRRTDTSIQILYEISERIFLSAGTTQSGLKVQYKDPSGGGVKVTTDPATMITPVRWTDYTLTQNSDGTGTDYTTDLVLTPVFSVDSVTFSVQNTGASDGYVWLRFRGYGIYIQDPVTYQVKDTTSIANYDVHSIEISQVYQNDPTISQNVATVALADRKDPTQTLESISYIANYSVNMMNAFLYYDVGDKITVVVTKRGISGNYFIQKVKFKITSGKVIYVTYFLTDSFSIVS